MWDEPVLPVWRCISSPPLGAAAAAAAAALTAPRRLIKSAASGKGSCWEVTNVPRSSFEQEVALQGGMEGVWGGGRAPPMNCLAGPLRLRLLFTFKFELEMYKRGKSFLQGIQRPYKKGESHTGPDEGRGSTNTNEPKCLRECSQANPRLS